MTRDLVKFAIYRRRPRDRIVVFAHQDIPESEVSHFVYDHLGGEPTSLSSSGGERSMILFARGDVLIEVWEEPKKFVKTQMLMNSEGILYLYKELRTIEEVMKCR